MWPIEMAPLPMTFGDHEGYFYKPFCLTYLWKCNVYYLRYVYTWIG